MRSVIVKGTSAYISSGLGMRLALGFDLGEEEVIKVSIISQTMCLPNMFV